MKGCLQKVRQFIEGKWSYSQILITNLNTYKILVPNELFSTMLMHFLKKKPGKKGVEKYWLTEQT